MNLPTAIIIHNTGGTEKNPLADTSHHTFEQVRRYHMVDRGYKDIGYHFFIERDGTLHVGRQESSIGAHTLGWNTKSIGICLAGNGDLNEFTTPQIDTLVNLVKKLKIWYNIEDSMIGPHSQFDASRTCAGKHLSKSKIQSLLSNNNMNDLIKSSQNPENVSLTVKGILMSLVPITMAIFGQLDIMMTESMVYEIIEAFTAGLSGITMLVGLFRKVFNTFSK